MAKTTISDWVIWAKHIHGDPGAVQKILNLRPGETLSLRVDGVLGSWRKMDDGRHPTPGIRPIGRTREFWRELYIERKGEVVGVELADSPEERLQPLPISPPLAATEAERQAAIDAFLAAGDQGWRSTGPYGPRDELYDR